MNKYKILAIGANGTVASEVVKILKADGHEVYSGTSKTPKSQEEVQLNLATGEGVKDAFAKAQRVFLLSPPGYADHYKILSPLIQEAKRQGLQKVVLMTAMGANADESTPFRRAEIELENSGLKYNIVRPNWFLQNFNTFWIQGINDNKEIQLPAGDARTSFIDSRDISAVIAKLLTDDSLSNQDFDITGPEAITHEQVAKAIGEEIGTQVTYEDIAPAELKAGLVQAGLPEDYVDFLLLIFSFLKEGYNAGVTDNVKKILGREPKSILTYVKDYKKAWSAV